MLSTGKYEQNPVGADNRVESPIWWDRPHGGFEGGGGRDKAGRVPSGRLPARSLHCLTPSNNGKKGKPSPRRECPAWGVGNEEMEMRLQRSCRGLPRGFLVEPKGGSDTKRPKLISPKARGQGGVSRHQKLTGKIARERGPKLGGNLVVSAKTYFYEAHGGGLLARRGGFSKKGRENKRKKK